MKLTQSLLCVLTAAAVLAGCAAVVPQELAVAREAYRRVSTGPAARLTPAEVHKASVALDDAEASFVQEPESFRTRDLAYVARRRAESAEALADIARDSELIAKANAEYEATQAHIVKETRQQLHHSQEALAESERGNQKSAERLKDEKKSRLEAEQRAVQAQMMTEEQLAAEKAARAAADVRAAEATAALAKLAAVKEDQRGQVITLSGSVLFASDEATLLPSAQARLGQVADALLATRQRTLVVEGHTDARGSDSHNVDLSLRRAQAVREFLIAKGYDRDRITAQGIGHRMPVADNGTADGRANNRRVEIVRR